ncbi:RNA polymerase sigma factor [Nonomuraea guangzhouensis]|uniref:RNA polymerase sigma factor n=1 Tax=Nonomuraea guangzhouensis TaxID=1291555 RepID=A0ABW4GY71_9ACTN|nr:RNA polymerase sigma factor [Nonomuraea guangzhouensis]
MTALPWISGRAAQGPVDRGEVIPGSPVDAEVISGSLVDVEVFGAVFDAYFGDIHGYVAQRLGVDHAEDVVSDTFLIAFRKRARYDPARATVRSWLFGIATKLIGKHRRLEARTLRALGRYGPDGDAPGHEDRVSARVSAQSLQPSLASALAGLEQRDRDVILLVALAGLSHEEIATALGIPYGTVGSRLSRARKKLRGSLGGTNPMLVLEEADHG